MIRSFVATDVDFAFNVLTKPVLPSLNPKTVLEAHISFSLFSSFC